MLNYSAPLANGGREDDWEIDGSSNPDDVTSNFKTDRREVRVHDLRYQQFRPRLDVNGFEMLKAPFWGDQSDLLDQTECAQTSYKQGLSDLLEEHISFDHIVFFDTTLRCEDTLKVNGKTRQRAHSRVHVDQNPSSARARARNHAPSVAGFSRFQIINVWRPLIEPVRNFPLAVCDYQSIDAGRDLVPTRLKFPDWLKDKENYSVKYNENHRWYYWGRLSPEELIVFKCYDSACGQLGGTETELRKRTSSTEIAGLCPHTSFFDVNGPATGHLRTSLEVRALVFHF